MVKVRGGEGATGVSPQPGIPGGPPRARGSPAPRPRPRPHEAAPGGGPGRGAWAGSGGPSGRAPATRTPRAPAPSSPVTIKGRRSACRLCSVCSFSSTCIASYGRRSDLSRQNGEADREQGRRKARARRVASVAAGEGDGLEVGRPPLRIPEEGDAAARPGAARSPGLGAP